MEPFLIPLGIIAYIAIGVFYAKRSAKREWVDAKEYRRDACGWDGCYSNREHVAHRTLSNVFFWFWRFSILTIAGWIERTVDDADPDKAQKILEEINRSRMEIDRKLEDEIETAAMIDARLKRAEKRLEKSPPKQVQPKNYKAMQYEDYPYLPMEYDDM